MPMSAHKPTERPTRLFLCGDVMTGRGIDQILRQPCDPVLHEPNTSSALDYVRLAEAANGPILRGVGPAYIWGAALDEFDRMRPDARIVNLETAITRSDNYDPKGINYRTSPDNAGCLKAAGIDCCVLGNNHVLDWGRSGLLDTLTALERLQIKTAGAGRNRVEAAVPAILDITGGGRALVFSFACATAGVPRAWAARSATPGVNFLDQASRTSALRIADQIGRMRSPDDLIVVSVHWGPNWGYEVAEEQRQFAHALIDAADVAVVYGHSSHHPKAVEVYRNRLILYGCGDFLNDYEGIAGYERYRDDLALMYFADFDRVSRALRGVEIVPLQIRNFHLVRPSEQDVGWMQRVLAREYGKFGAGLLMKEDGHFALSWEKRAAPQKAI